VVRPCRETIALSKVKEQLQAAAAEVENVVLAGNINLDTTRRCNVRYGRRCIMLAHDSAVADSNMRYLETGITYRSHGIGRPLWGEDKVNATIKINPVCTESCCGWMERSAKPIKAAKKRKALQQGEDGQVGQNLQSVPYRAAFVRR
jgi:hypothetical protein